MKLLKYIIPAVILKKMYKKSYATKSKPTTDLEQDAADDLKDDEY